MGQEEKRDTVLVIVGEKKYRLNRELLKSRQKTAISLDVTVNGGYANVLRISEGYALSTDTFQHFIEGIGSDMTMLVRRLLKKWMLSGKMNKTDQDLERLFDRYKKNLLDELLAQKILEEPSDDDV